jgi:PHD/YefM family antitoxin component YafN of YafNO toxin-antitoxin module
MKLDLQYVSDVNGKTNAVQLSLSDWEKLLNKLKKYEQTLKIKSDLKEAYEQVISLKEGRKNKQTLSEFLNEL